MATKKSLRDFAIGLDQRWDKARLKLLQSFGGASNLEILSYGGFGRPEKIMLKGRVLVKRKSTQFDSTDDFWDDLVKMYRRLSTTEIPGARVKVSAMGVVAEAVTDEEGYFDVELEAADKLFTSPRQQIELELLDPAAETPVVAKGQVVVRNPKSSFLVISDIDDTVVHTQATNMFAMARATFLGNASSRTPFAGVAELYQAFVDGPTGKDENPLIFISRSPWNLYDLFDQFCDLQGMPGTRTFYLRDWGFSKEGLTRASSKGHKFRLIRRILEIDPEVPVILIGDSGQMDPEIYHAISEEFPGRLLGAFIRDVTLTVGRSDSISNLASEVASDGAFLYLTEDSLSVAQKAVEHGWIREEAIATMAAVDGKMSGVGGGRADSPDQ